MLLQVFLKNQKKKYGKVMVKYVEVCVVLCLYMCVQDFVVYIDFDMFKGKFDKDKYRVYMKFGEEYVFFVWFLFFFYKEGLMFGKGIV